MQSERAQKILGSSSQKIKKIQDSSTEYFLKAQKNCENMIGTAKIPIGVAGPLIVKGKYAHGKYILPLATTEGALVASVNRGCKVITENGGAQVTAKKIGISRAPVFEAASEVAAKQTLEWLQENTALLTEETMNTSQYLQLLDIETKTVGTSVFIRFWFDAADAMGMNMATIASAHLCNLITEKTGAKLIALSSNWCADKKPAKTHSQKGRGFSATAEFILNKKSIQEVLKTSPEKMLQVSEKKIEAGSELAGSLGKNAHHANIIAALYLATGQDMAHVVEGSHGNTLVEKHADGLRVSVTLPAIVCGVIGGGTQLPTQREALDLLNIRVDEKNPGTANHQFAEIIAGAVLAGEISLLAALASNDLAKAHEAARQR